MEKTGKIKLIQVIADSSIGGGPTHVLGILKHIDQNIFETYLICPSGNLLSKAKDIKGIKVIKFNPRNKFDLFAILRLRAIFHQIRSTSNPFGPMIVHSHGPRAGFLTRIISLFGVKNVYTEHRYDIDFHLKNIFNELIQKKILAKQNFGTDLIIAVSSSVRKFLINAKMAPSDKIVVIPNGIDLSAVSKSASQQVSSKAPIIGNIGNLNIQKGQEYLIEAMALIRERFPLCVLEIVGEGELRKKLTQKIRDLGLERNVKLLGSVDNIEKYAKHWSVFVLPSIAETFGIVILEAMSLSLPVVASKVGGVVDIITNKKNGILISSRNSEAIAKAVIDIIEHPVLAAKLKREGLMQVKKFELKNIVKMLEKEYINLVGEEKCLK